MEENRLTKWLEQRADEHISSQSTESEYYVINKMKVRVSDHMTTNDMHDLDVIFMAPKRYIIIPTNARFKKPTLCVSWKAGVEFIDGWLKYVTPYLSVPTKVSLPTILPEDKEASSHAIIEDAAARLRTAPSGDMVVAIPPAIAGIPNMNRLTNENVIDVESYFEGIKLSRNDKSLFTSTAKEMYGKEKHENEKLVDILTKNLNVSWWNWRDTERRKEMEQVFHDLIPYFNGNEYNMKLFCKYIDMVGGYTMDDRIERVTKVRDCVRECLAHGRNHFEILTGAKTLGVLMGIGPNWFSFKQPDMLMKTIWAIDDIFLTGSMPSSQALITEMNKHGGYNVQQKYNWLRQLINK